MHQSCRSRSTATLWRRPCQQRHTERGAAISEPTMRAALIAGFVTIILFTSGVVVAETSISEQNVLKGHNAFGQYAFDRWQKDKPSVRRLLRGVRQLLEPEGQTPVGKSPSKTVQRSNQAKP